jgi:hypothetical protein
MHLLMFVDIGAVERSLVLIASRPRRYRKSDAFGRSEFLIEGAC